MKKHTNNIQDDYLLYQKGLDYKTEIGLFATVDKNNRFVSGDQWNGVAAAGLPTPVFNVLKRVRGFKVSSIMQNAIKIKFQVENGTPEQEQMADVLNHECENLWERLKMDSSNENILSDAFTQGDGVTFYWWNKDINTGQMWGLDTVLGDIRKEEIDNVCVFPGDCNNPIINTADGPVQPYMLIVTRKPVEDVKAEAKRNKVEQSEIDKITSDEENTYTAGDRGKIELDDRNEESSGKANVILKMWKNDETGTIWARKTTKSVVIKNDYDTELRLYPIAMMNWETVKNSFHGMSEVTGVIPNQIYVNKLAAMIMMATMYVSFPKMVYDGTRVNQPSNQIGTAIKVNGQVEGAIKNLSPGQISGDAFKFFPDVMQYTKDMMGANETALGDTSVTETAKGIMALQQASAVPLKSYQRRFYQYIEDIALIWLDFFMSKYKVPRMVNYKDEQGNAINASLDMGMLQNARIVAKIDVGPSTMWSEIASVQSLDALLNTNHITEVEYYERIPSSIIPDKKGLVDSRKAIMAQQQAMANAPQITPEAIMAQLTPEEQEAVRANPALLDEAVKGLKSA
jgi:hypothetical protein